MGGTVCAGCGKTLPAPGRRGRPATYHGPVCRQRARRARLAAEPARAELLGLLDRAGRAVAAARRAATSGDDPRAALAELAIVVDLTRAGYVIADTTAPRAEDERASARIAEPVVTKSVTESAIRETRPVTCVDLIDVETVRVERGEDFEASGTYRVLTDDSILLGYLTRDLRRRWEARTASTFLTVPGGPWRTRQDALVGLLRNGGIHLAEAPPM